MTSQIVYQGNLRTVATHLQSGTQIETDAPVDNQGKGERFSPTDLVATALGNCMLTIMGIKARDMNVNLEGTKIDITKIMAAEPRRIGEIKVVINFPVELQADEKQRTILERAAMTCPVFESLHPAMKKDVEFKWS
jgi:putative redox protein